MFNMRNLQLLLLLLLQQSQALRAPLYLVDGHPVVHNDVLLDRVLFVVTVALVFLRQRIYLPLQQRPQQQQQQQQQHDND